jgi:hypothetical protein
MALGKSPGGGFAFSAKALGSGPSSFSERVGSFQQARSLGGGAGGGGLGGTSLSGRQGLHLPGLGQNMMNNNNNNNPYQNQFGGQQGPPPPNSSFGNDQQVSPQGSLGGGSSVGTNRGNLVGVVAKTASAYNADEELFHVQNNTGWRVGLMTDKRSIDCINELCHVLRSKNMEWKTVAPYLLAVRRKVDPRQQASGVAKNSSSSTAVAVHSNQSTVLQIHLLRIQEKHEKGFVVDFFFARGCPIAALEMTIEIWRDLLRRVG